MLSGIVAMAISEMLTTTAQALGSAKAGKVMLGTRTHAACADQVKVDQTKRDGDEVPDNRTEQDGQHPKQSLALQVYRESDGHDQCDECNQPVCSSFAECRTGQRNTDDDGNAAGNDRGQNLIQRCPCQSA